MQISKENVNRLFYKQLKSTLARLLILKRKKYICYHFAFKTTKKNVLFENATTSRRDLKMSFVISIL